MHHFSQPNTQSPASSPVVFRPAKVLVEAQEELCRYFDRKNHQAATHRRAFDLFRRANENQALRSLILSEDLEYKRLERKDPEIVRQSRLNTLARLQSNFALPQYYAGNRHSPRIDAKGTHLLSLDKHCRRRVFQGFRQADLASSQMTLLASVLRVPEMVEFFKEGRSLWDFLAAQTGYERARIKQYGKSVLYGIAFGMTLPEISKGLSLGGIPNLIEVPMIASLIERRQGAYRRLHNLQPTLVDELGSRHTFYEPKGLSYQQTLDEQYIAKNILACTMQSYEFLIMAQLARFLEKIDCWAWLHDGIIYADHDPVIEEQMQATIQTFARERFEQPIFTKLEFETL